MKDVEYYEFPALKSSKIYQTTAKKLSSKRWFALVLSTAGKKF